jgi:nitrite reductase (NADH) large subunit
MKIVIAGNGMVSHKFCEKLLRHSPKDLEITVFGEELRPAYDRVHLSEYYAGKSAEHLQLASKSW